MSLAPSMPMFWDAYLADTTHLTTEEHGAYLLLLGAMWRRNGWVPDDDKDNARILGMTVAKWRKVKDRLRDFLVFEDGQISLSVISEWIAEDRKIRARPPIPKDIADYVRKRDGDCCMYCNTIEGPFELDHITPWSRGGDHEIDNLVVSCRACNRRKGDRTPIEMGWAWRRQDWAGQPNWRQN